MKQIVRNARNGELSLRTAPFHGSPSAVEKVEKSPRPDATSRPARMPAATAMPPVRGTGPSWCLRGPGWSIPCQRQPRRAASGTAAADTAPAAISTLAKRRIRDIAGRQAASGCRGLPAGSATALPKRRAPARSCPGPGVLKGDHDLRGFRSPGRLEPAPNVAGRPVSRHNVGPGIRWMAVSS